MQIVIDISDEKYQTILNHTEEILDASSFIEPKYLYRAVLEGEPLPKGHGRLGDLDALNNGLREQQRSYQHTFGIRQPINEAVKDGIIIARTHIDHAPTIIEADMVTSESPK